MGNSEIKPRIGCVVLFFFSEPMLRNYSLSPQSLHKLESKENAKIQSIKYPPLIHPELCLKLAPFQKAQRDCVCSSHSTCKAKKGDFFKHVL